MERTLGKTLAEEMATRLFDAFQTGNAIGPLSEQEPTMGAFGAYEVQEALLELHKRAGRKVVARKVGLTSKAIQAQMNVDQPDYGVVLDEFALSDRSSLSRSDLGMIAPKIEGELSFILDEELRGPGVNAIDVLSKTRAVVPTLEIIDSRIDGWRIKLPDTIADNASCWGMVLGETLTRPTGLDLTAVGMVLERNGEVLATGAGAAVLDHPARAVAWLANKLAEYGAALPAGEPVLSGSLTAAVDAVPGVYQARFGDSLGSVAIQISE